MKLSVIIPCFNAADTIAIQLEALASQEWSEPWEIIVSDNGSTDDSVTIVEQYRKRLLNLRIVDSSDRKGAAHARNVGVRAAAGEALAFCDADDEVAPGWLKAMGEALSRNEVVAGRMDDEKLNEPWTRKARRCPQREGIQGYSYPPYLPHAASCNIGIKRSLYEVVGEFDESFYFLDDTDYCWRCQLGGREIHFVPDALVHYRFRHTLGGIYRQALNYAEYNVLLYKKYRSLGMPKLSSNASMKAWLNLLKHLLKVFLGKESFSRWVWQFGWRMGRLNGCIKYMVFAL